MYSNRKLKKLLKGRTLFQVIAFALLAFVIYFTIIRKDEEIEKKNAASAAKAQDPDNIQFN